MVRAALASRHRIGQGPRTAAAYVPAMSVVAMALLARLPIVTALGWYPDFGFLALLAWRLLRADPFPAWWAAPLGLANDLIVGTPIGYSIVLWTVVMLAMDIIDRRTMWRDYWIEWALAALMIAVGETFEWSVAGIMGADLPFSSIGAPALISVLAFPLVAWVVSRVDRWRLGR